MPRQLLPLAACLFLAGCEEVGLIEKPKYDALQQKLNEAQQQLKDAQGELTKAQQQVSECQAHKYQIYTQGARTWRLDSVSGKTCVLLASEQDWKNPKTTESSCSCEDGLNRKYSYELLHSMGCFGKVGK